MGLFGGLANLQQHFAATFSAKVSAIKERRDSKELKQHKRQSSRSSWKRHHRQASSVANTNFPLPSIPEKAHQRQASSVTNTQVLLPSISEKAHLCQARSADTEHVPLPSIPEKAHQRQASSADTERVTSSVKSKWTHRRKFSSIYYQRDTAAMKVADRFQGLANIVTRSAKAWRNRSRSSAGKPAPAVETLTNEPTEYAEKTRAEALLRLISVAEKEQKDKERAEALFRLIEIADTQAKGAPDQGRVRIDSKDPTDNGVLDYYLESAGEDQAGDNLEIAGEDQAHDNAELQDYEQVAQEDDVPAEVDRVLEVVNRDPGTESQTSSAHNKVEMSTPPTSLRLPQPSFDASKLQKNSKNSEVHSENQLPESQFPRRFRADWKALKNIGHYEFKQVLAQHLEVPDLDYDLDFDFEFVKEANGGYNYVRMYKLKVGPRAGVYVVKIPNVGTRKAGWCDRDAYMLRSEFATMKTIFTRTNCPVPEPIGYDATLDNDLTAPYLIMTAVKGVPAARMWFDNTIDEDGERLYDYDGADEPSPERTKMRKALMTSLAEAMAELQKLKFTETGRIVFKTEDSDDPNSVTAGPAYFCAEDSNGENDDPYPNYPGSMWLEEAPTNTSFDFWMRGVRLHEMPDHQARNDTTTVGLMRILHILLNYNPFNFSCTDSEIFYMNGEAFTLRHGDLNFQNIYVDELTGRITGIIDWGDAHIAPFCMGWALPPFFLLEDWYSDYNILNSDHAPWVLEEYRDFYADALVTMSGNEQAGRVVRGGGLVAGLYHGMFGGCAKGNKHDVVEKILGRLGGLSGYDASCFITKMGMEEKWRVGERWLADLAEMMW